MTSPWVGSAHTVASLTSVLSDGFPALLLGPGGVGKYKLALEVARTLGDPVLAAPGVAGIAEMVAAISVRSQRKKIVVLSLDTHSHPLILNRLLKVLEEPGEVGFVLTCSHRPLATVASRCVVVPVAALPAAQVGAALLALTEEELSTAGVVGLTSELAWWAGRSAGGRVGVGLSLVAAQPFVGRAGAFLRAVVETDRASGLATLAALSADKEEAMAVVLLLSTWASEVIRFGACVLLGDTHGAERRASLLSGLAALKLSRGGSSPALELRMVFEREVLAA